jgi:hypothetical protein
MGRRVKLTIFETVAHSHSLLIDTNLSDEELKGVLDKEVNGKRKYITHAIGDLENENLKVLEFEEDEDGDPTLECQDYEECEGGDE